jgi:hypothetical protein
LVGDDLALFIHDKEVSVFWEVLYMDATHIQDPPLFVVGGLAKSFGEVRP